MNNSNFPQENIELESQQIELKELETPLKERPEYKVGMTTPPFPGNCY